MSEAARVEAEQEFAQRARDAENRFGKSLYELFREQFILRPERFLTQEDVARFVRKDRPLSRLDAWRMQLPALLVPTAAYGSPLVPTAAYSSHAALAAENRRWFFASQTALAAGRPLPPFPLPQQQKDQHARQVARGEEPPGVGARGPAITLPTPGPVGTPSPRDEKKIRAAVETIRGKVMKIPTAQVLLESFATIREEERGRIFDIFVYLPSLLRNDPHMGEKIKQQVKNAAETKDMASPPAGVPDMLGALMPGVTELAQRLPMILHTEFQKLSDQEVVEAVIVIAGHLEQELRARTSARPPVASRQR